MVGATLGILTNSGIGPSGFSTKTDGATVGPATNVKVDDASGLANGDKIKVAGKTYTISNVTATTFDISPGLGAGEQLNDDTQVERVQVDLTTIQNSAEAAGVFTYTVQDIRDFADNDHVMVDGKEYVVTAKDANAKTFKLNNVFGAAAGKKNQRRACQNR